jgi:hypothetical protein
MTITGGELLNLKRLNVYPLSSFSILAAIRKIMIDPVKADVEIFH